MARDVEPGDALLQRILASRSAQVRTVLPTGDVEGRAPHQRAAILAVAAGIVLLGGLFLAWGSGDASAGARIGLLRFDPPRPIPGALVRALYTPSASLQRYDSLVLRARFRHPGDGYYNYGMTQQRVVALRRTTSDGFSGAFRLPDSVVFAVFAVESPSGDVVDDNDQRLWELVTADTMGRPLFEALVQRRGDLMGRNWEELLRVSRSLASLYPESPEAWSMLVPDERHVLGDHIADSLLPGYRRRFATLQQELSERTNLPVDVVSGMLSFATLIDDTAAAHFWRARLNREFPDNPDVLFWRENRFREDRNIDGAQVDPRQARRYFAALEPLWAKAEPSHDRTLPMFAQNALGIAMEAEDSAALRVWSSRYRQVQRRIPEDAAYWGRILIQHPGVRADGMAWLRDEARLLAKGPDEYRSLTATVAEQQAANRVAAQPILAELADGLIDQGDTTAGLDTLRLAVTYGWNPSAFLRVGQIWASLGDTLQALRTYAKAAADPGSSRGFSDSIRAIMAPKSSAVPWDEWVHQAREEMRAAVLQGVTPRALEGPTRLVASGGEVRLTDLASGHVTVVAFWSPACGFSVRDLGPLQRMANQLQHTGAKVVAIVDYPFSTDLTRTLKEQHAERLPVFYDYRSDMRRAFVNFGTPDYFVLDESGRIVFAHSRLEEIPRQVAALLPERTASAH